MIYKVESYNPGSQHYRWKGLACMVRISKRPRKSFRETTSPKMVRYMSADVPLYHGNMGRKSGCSSLVGSTSSLQACLPPVALVDHLTESLHGQIQPARQQLFACQLQDINEGPVAICLQYHGKEK